MFHVNRSSVHKHVVHVCVLTLQWCTCMIVVLESGMPYLYYVDNGVLFKMTLNQSMVQLVADVTTAAAAVTGIVSLCMFAHLIQVCM